MVRQTGFWARGLRHVDLQTVSEADSDGVDLSQQIWTSCGLTWAPS